MPEEHEHSPNDLKTPEEWQRITGVTVIDADGWGGKNGRSFEDAIGYVEWNRRMSRSTVEFPTTMPETPNLGD